MRSCFSVLASRIQLAARCALCGLLVATIDVGCSGASDDNGGDQQPITPATCGNGVIEPGEDCDGILPANTNCSSATMGVLPIGQVKCNAICRVDATGCTSGASAGGAPNIAGAPNVAGAPMATGGGPSATGGGPSATGGGPPVPGGP